MLLTADNHVTAVTLSERNVRELLAAFESGRDATIYRRMQDGTGQMLLVRVESDRAHYAARLDAEIAEARESIARHAERPYSGACGDDDARQDYLDALIREREGLTG